MGSRKEPESSSNKERDLQDRIEEGVGQLLTELQQGSSARLEQYLAFAARFHRYSFANQLLIHSQCPEATYVAGYRKWQELGYQVAAGAQAIRIFAPRPYKVKNSETGEEEERIGFRPVGVFDASQLANREERPLPSFFTPLSDNRQGLYDRLAGVVRGAGIVIKEERLSSSQGYSASGRITLREGLDSTNRFLTLLHEYTHELLHWGTGQKDRPREVKECHAEAVAFVVALHFGVHNPFSADYLHNWGTTPKELLAELEVVRRTAAYIIEQMGAPEGLRPEDLSPDTL